MNNLLATFNVFLLVAVRVLAMIEVAPLFSSPSIPQVAKVGLAGFTAAAVMPLLSTQAYSIPSDGAAYALLLLGEAMIGLIMGFFLSIVFSAFTTAGHYFSLQIGFSASEVFDPLAETEIPLMSQFLNIIAMFIFVSTNGFQKLFLSGVANSIVSLRASDLVASRNDYIQFLLTAIGGLFLQSLILAIPVMGTLFIISIAMGLLSKAAPQINLLAEGFPIAILVSFIILILALPVMIQTFSNIIDSGFEGILQMQGGKS